MLQEFGREPAKPERLTCRSIALSLCALRLVTGHQQELRCATPGKFPTGFYARLMRARFKVEDPAFIGFGDQGRANQPILRPQGHKRKACLRPIQPGRIRLTEAKPVLSARFLQSSNRVRWRESLERECRIPCQTVCLAQAAKQPHEIRR